MKVSWKEHWDFLHAFEDLTSISGIHRLEQYLAERVAAVCQRRSLENDLNEMSDNLKQMTLNDSQHASKPVDLNVTPNFVQYLNVVEGSNVRGTRTDSFEPRGIFSVSLDRSDSSASSGSYYSAEEDLEDVHQTAKDVVVYLVR
jgi:hypothetical protein